MIKPVALLIASVFGSGSDFKLTHYQNLGPGGFQNRQH